MSAWIQFIIRFGWGGIDRKWLVWLEFFMTKSEIVGLWWRWDHRRRYNQRSTSTSSFVYFQLYLPLLSFAISFAHHLFFLFLLSIFAVLYMWSLTNSLFLLFIICFVFPFSFLKGKDRIQSGMVHSRPQWW